MGRDGQVRVREQYFWSCLVWSSRQWQQVLLGNISKSDFSFATRRWSFSKSPWVASGRWYVTTSFKSFAISCFEFGGLGDVLLHALICSKMQSDSCDAAAHCYVGLSEKKKLVFLRWGWRNLREAGEQLPRKWRENQKMKKKWRANEKMERKWRENEKVERERERKWRENEEIGERKIFSLSMSSLSCHFLSL